MSSIDYRALKLIPIGSVLHHHKIETRRQGDYLVAVKCPLPSHTSEEKDTFKVSLKENWWTCFSGSCRKAYGKNGGDVIDLVKAIEGIGAKDAARKLADLFCVAQLEPLAEICNTPLKFKLMGNPEHPLIQSRGISVETARNWDVGFYCSRQGTASMDDRIIFPLIEDGSLVGYLGRATLEGQEPRWKFGAQKKTFLFGLERAATDKPLVIAESCWASLWFWERGQQCAALMGSELTEAQEQRLTPFDVLILAMDADEKGREAAAKIAARLKKNHRVIKATLKEG